MQVRDDDSHQPNRSRILTFTVSVEAPYCWKADAYRGRIETILREKLGVECLLNVAHVPDSLVAEPTPGVVKRQKAAARRAAKAERRPPHLDGALPPLPPTSFKNPPRRGKSDWNATIQDMLGLPPPLKRTKAEKERQFAEMYGVQFTGGEIDLPGGGGVSYLGFDEGAPGGDHSAVVVRQDATGVDDMVFPPIIRKLAPYESHKPTRDRAPEPQSLGDTTTPLGVLAARLVAEVAAKRAREGKRAMCCHKTVPKGAQCEDCPYVD